MNRADPQRKSRQPPRAPEAAEPRPRRQSLQDVLDGEEPDDEFLDEWRALDDAPELDDDDLEQQALAARREDEDE